MSKASPADQQANRGARSVASESVAVTPMKRRPILFYSLLAVYLLWMAGLIAMYFVTARKDAAHSPAPASAPVQALQGG